VERRRKVKEREWKMSMEREEGVGKKRKEMKREQKGGEDEKMNEQVIDREDTVHVDFAEILKYAVCAVCTELEGV